MAETKGQTERKIVTSDHALQSMMSTMLNGFRDLRDVTEVLEEQIPALRDVTIQNAVDVTEMAVTLERAKKALATVESELARADEVIASQEENAIKQGVILSELMAIKDKPKEVTEFLGNVATLVVNFDMYMSSSASFVSRVLKLAHPHTRSEALADLPLHLLTEWRDNIELAIAKVSARMLGSGQDEDTSG